ncbi:SCO family protein [Hoeflea sp. CAU 1731]
MRTIRIASWTAVAVLLVTLIGVYIFQSVFGRTNGPISAGSSIGVPFTLTDHDGHAITEKALTGQPSAVFFGFTHCPEVCPTTLYELSVWFEALGDEGNDLQAYFITVDPQRDTPQVMKSYVENFTDRITGITGDPETVERVARAWNIYWKKVPLDDGDYTMDHTASIFLVDAKGNFQGTIAYGEENETALAKLKRLANG